MQSAGRTVLACLIFAISFARAQTSNIVCEALVDGSVNAAAEEALRQFAKSLSAEEDASVHLTRFDDLPEFLGSSATAIGPSVIRLGEMKDAQLVLREALREPFDPTVIHVVHPRSQAQWDIHGRSNKATRTQSYRLSLFELRKARVLSEDTGRPVVVEAKSPNGYSYVAAFRNGFPIATEFEPMNELVPSLGLSRAKPKDAPSPPVTPAAPRPRLNRKAPANAVEIWQTSVREKIPTVIELPFQMTKSLSIGLLDLPFRLGGQPDVSFALGFVKTPQSVIPFWKDSGHSPHVIYVDGLQYVLKFRRDADRTHFLQNFWKVSSSLLDKGEIVGRTPDETRYTVILKPEQFAALATAFTVHGLPAESDGFTPSTWSEVKTMNWVHTKTTKTGVRYYFDRRQRAVAVRRDGHFSKIESSSAEIARNAASHAEILKRQRAGRDVVSARVTDADVASDLGIGVANRAADAVELALRDMLQKPEHAELSGKILDANARFGLDASPANLISILKVRKIALARLTDLDSRTIAGDARLASVELCQRESEGVASEMVHRFGWLPKVPLHAGGLILSRFGDTIHHQLFALSLGRPVLAALDPLEDLRGGMLRLSYGTNGRLENAVVIAGRMWTQIGTNPSPIPIDMSVLEKQMLGMQLVNWCNERHRGDQTVFSHGTEYLGARRK